MIEKMKFLSITGPKADIDRVVNTYLSKYEIHLENALSELTAVESLSPFMEINPYKEALSTANSFYDELADPEKISAKPMDTEQALNTIRRIQSDYQELSIHLSGRKPLIYFFGKVSALAFFRHIKEEF